MSTEPTGNLVLIGWQFRFVFPTFKGDWSPLMECPRKIHSGDPAPPQQGVTFEVRDVFVQIEEASHT